MPAKEGDTVKVHYKGKLEDGNVFDSSEGKEPIEFKLGEGKIIPGFEKAVSGMEKGEKKTVKVASDDAYGPVKEEAVVALDKKQLPPDIKPQKGQLLQMQKEGQTIVVNVTDVGEEKITIDANHPLAGKDLVFDLELVEIG